jgi:superfamily II DNA or RNA helicase
VSSLRDYQQEALDGLYAGWAGGQQRLGVSLPTGVGKTHIMAHLGRREAAERQGHGRVLYLVHRDALVDQTLAKLRATLDPGTSIGVLKAERNELGARVIVASVHSLRSARRRAQLPPIRLGVVDEAHVSVSPTYRAVYDQIGAFEPGGARLAGFTATWSRSDSTGLGDVWQDVVYHKTIKWATKRGHLVPVRGIRIGDGADVSDARVSRTTGDYSEADLERVVMLDEIRDAVVKGVLRHRGDRPGVLFAPTVASAEFFAEGLREAGISTTGWYHNTPKTQRRWIDAALRSGELQMMSTCTAVAEGYDNPQLGLGVLVRPTQHEGLFVQMVGRLLRPWPGKRDALLLDCVGATEDVHLRNAIDLSITRETIEGDPEPIEPDEIDEPVGRAHKARVRSQDTEVELFAGTQVQWLTSPVGVPFVSCGDTLVFIVEGQPGAWNVGQIAARLGADGKPSGGWVAEGLSQEDALTLASDHAENEGTHLARRSAQWRSGTPSDAQLTAAGRMGLVVPEGASRGQVSDQLSIAFAGRALAPVARWSIQTREYETA